VKKFLALAVAATGALWFLNRRKSTSTDPWAAHSDSV